MTYEISQSSFLAREVFSKSLMTQNTSFFWALAKLLVCGVECQNIKVLIFSSFCRLFGWVEFDESVVDNSGNLLVDWRVIQYNAACNFICYHDARIVFWSFLSSGIMADKLGDLCGAGCVQNHKFVIGFVTIRSGQKDPEEPLDLFWHQRKGRKLCF